MKIALSRDAWAGLMFIAFGLAFVIIARDYAMGTAVRMGPAYFPTVLGGLVALLGLVIFIQGLLVDGPRVGRLHFRPLVIIIVAICLFGLLLRPLGLVLATIVLVMVSAAGGGEFRWREITLLAVVLAAFSVAVFVYGLGLPFPLWPGQ
jgi:hypothetical protein